MMLLRCRSFVAALLLGVSHATVQPYITTSNDIDTECKTCPHTLCPNQDAFSGTADFNVTCWTRGTRIVGDTLWLKTQSGCYVTDYDTAEYAGDYTADLAYCGRASEEEHLTLADAALKYKTECRICPDLECDNVAYLPEGTDLTLTCWTNESTQAVLDNPYWYKTTNNCYVAEVGLHDEPDTSKLDFCGPLPGLLEYQDHYGDANGTTNIDKRHVRPASKEGRPSVAKRNADYLIAVHVGEDVANCYAAPDNTTRVEQSYVFNQTVILQCLVWVNETTWWSQTTDFCYVQDADFWESPEGDYYRNPYCSDFAGGI